MHNQCVTTLADQHFNRMTLFFSLVIAVANQHVFLMLLSDNVYRFNQRTEKGIRDIHHHHANGIADLRGKRLRIGIRAITQLGHGFHYGFAGVRADQRAVVQHA